MQDLKIKKEKQEKPGKRKKIFWIIFAVMAISLIALLAYGFTRVMRIFDTNYSGGSSFFAEGKSELKGEGDGRINILVAGMGGTNHPGGMLTDSIMVVSIDPKNKSLAMLSIPRDLYVPIADHNYSAKINETYSIGEKEKKGSGANLMKKTIGSVLDLQIHYYTTIDFKGFEKIIDTLGGIDVLVEKAIYDPLYPADDMIHYSPFSIKAGQQHLDGKTALKFARSRETTSDFDRASRQQKVIKSIKDKALTLGFFANPKKVIDTFSALSDSVRTDFTPTEIRSLVTLIKDISSDKIISNVLTDDSSGPLISDSSSGTYYLKPRDGNFDEVKRIAHEIFTDPNLREENAKIEILNGSTQSGVATKLLADLKSYGYNVTKTGNSKDSVEKTVIYDYSNNQKVMTLQFLKKRLNVEVVKASRTSDLADISIVIGDDYKGFSKTK